MKNVIIGILALGLIGLGYYTATKNLRLRLETMEGKTEKVIRGDLTIPINATGEVQPSYRIEIKAEASGEVIEIAREPGDRVAAGDLLIRLQKDDEQRSVDRARQDMTIAQARLDTARIRLELAKGSDLKNAQSQVDQLVPMVELAKFRKDKIERMDESITNDEEILARRTELTRQEAQLAAATANLEKAKLAIPLAEHSVSEAGAAFEAAKSTLADAEKRLSETEIRSPIDGVVGDIKTQIGAVIQGGKTTLTGGTVLAVVLNMDELVIKAEIDEAEIGRVLEVAPSWAKPGRPADDARPADYKEAIARMEHPPTITVEAYRDEVFTGVISTIRPEPETRTGVITYLVDILLSADSTDQPLSERQKQLLSGMRADVTFTSQHVSNVLLCPNEAIRQGPTGQFGVYVPKPGSTPQERKFEFVECKFGLDNGNFSEVREGLTEGMEVFTKLPSAERDRDKDKRS